MKPKFYNVFVTGGAGYIGSHCIIELLQMGYDVIAADNFINSVDKKGEAISLKRVELITGRNVMFYKCDLLDKECLEKIFLENDIDCVIHFAAMKSVGESMQFPLLYYQNNVVGSFNLIETMRKHCCKRLIYSSSCTIYGNPTFLPITEEHPVGNDITNVYGKTKYIVEEMLKDISTAETEWKIISLRYFNPVGAHPSGLIGEHPTNRFTNLMPFMSHVASKKEPLLTIFGGDYNTRDGTGLRDYIHVMDLASGHVAALEKLQSANFKFKAYNLGTGNGTTVLELIKIFEKANNVAIPYTIVDRRQGDIVAMYANADLAMKELAWKPKYSLRQMCEDFWRWQMMNPEGYKVEESKTTGSSASYYND